jgi:nucleoid-associated protein YgaU
MMNCCGASFPFRSCNRVTFRWKTIGGLLLVALVGSGAALVFQRSPTAKHTADASAASATSLASPSRGRIVPLVIDDAAPLPAFVPSISQTTRDNAASLGRLESLPTIRASAASEPTHAPTLAQDFPRPLDLAVVDDKREEVSFAPIAPPTIAAKPAISGPRQHVIVDGDTLPQLAEQYFGDRSRASEIFAQNRDVLSSPELLPLGVTIEIGDAR